jgi:histidinol-phosphate aminotransferase
VYAACTHAAGGDALRIRPGADLAFQLDDIRAALDERTSLLYVTSPGNPTGRSVPVQTIAALAAGARDVTILVDEAYVDFGGETAIPLVDTHHNVIVGRTFAKAFGLAALRAGCLVAHPETLAPLRAMVPPYTLNVAAAAGLRAALRDRAWRDHYIRESEQSRRMVYEFCEARGLPYYRSDANFVLVRVGKAGAVVDALAARGIFIRDRSSQPGCAGCVRITAGVVAHTAHCLDALAEVL